MPNLRRKYTNPTTGAVINYYEITISPLQQQVYPGLGKANLVGYDGISPGPTFKMERGEEAVVRFINKASIPNSVHLHGSYSFAPFDGWAEDTTSPGQYKDYYYPNAQSARTLWYHDHAVFHTAENAYYGQAGFYILHDSAEDSLGLPSGDYDIPLGLSSKQYQSNGDLFSPNGETDSLFGDVIHVNGQPWPYLKVEPRKYRFRLLDTSISRAFQLSLQDDKSKKIDFNVIASDAGLLSSPVPTNLLHISMAERWEIVVDFSQYAGKNITMKNERDVQADEDYNSTDKVMRFVVGNKVTSTANNNLPGSLRSVPFPPNKSGVDRSFKFERKGGEWTINGVTFADVENRILGKPQRGQVEVWELENSSGGWSHPVHIHLIDFQVISRTGGKRDVLPYEKNGLKDVVLLGVNEKVRVVARFQPWEGVYMFHCHNLIHEDHDMMAAFNVSTLSDYGYDQKETLFIDPMESRWRAKDVKTEDFTTDAIQSKLAAFAEINRYKDVAKIESALENYWKTAPTGFKISTTSSTPSSTAATSTASSSGSNTSITAPIQSPATTSPATTSTKADDKGKAKTSTTKTK
ncbi:Multicopper oxidase type 1 [Macrophomina phaseolina MS6]|uniref:Multicopper oxidase type 1 n=1 Tax=Macrophomina phaseolina (strain MS6) TaxID=1126212 RepID=K2S0N9_MACPH|nr:Multicopper oxidase type 1 [Macrophomina phaseolina MS6]